MKYTVSEKTQQTVPAVFGGGVRYRITLSSLYPFPTYKQITASRDKEMVPPSTDNFSSIITVDKATFDLLNIGDEMAIKIAVLVGSVTSPESDNG